MNMTSENLTIICRYLMAAFGLGMLNILGWFRGGANGQVVFDLDVVATIGFLGVISVHVWTANGNGKSK